MSASLCLAVTQVRIPSHSISVQLRWLPQSPPSNHLQQPYLLTPYYWDIFTTHTLSYIYSVLGLQAFFWILEPWGWDQIGCLEMSDRNYHYYSLRNNPEECSFGHNWIWLYVKSQCSSCNPQLSTRFFFVLLCSHCPAIPGKTVVLFMKTTHVVGEALLYCYSGMLLWYRNWAV